MEFITVITQEFIGVKKKIDDLRRELKGNMKLTTQEKIGCENALMVALLKDTAAVILLNVGISYTVSDLLPLFRSFYRGEDLHDVRRCRICGCTYSDCSGCIKKTGKPCSWVSKDLCSACLIVTMCEECGKQIGSSVWCLTCAKHEGLVV